MSGDRAAGILLHPTSWPGSPAIGDLGAEPATAFLDWMASAGFGLWQILPLAPPAAGDSPYSALSAFALAPTLISPKTLADEGLLAAEDLADAPPASDRVDFAAAQAWKEPLLRRAWQRFSSRADADRAADFAAYREREAPWLDDWALFAVLKRRHGGAAWWEWEPELARREGKALERVRRGLAEELDFERFLQHTAERQWQAIRDLARERGIRILGDLPIYLARDSAEVWASSRLFELGKDLAPLAVAGVPPDYFAADGQLWGNPLYRWDAIAADGYRWWIARLARQLALADLVRLDHFRGFAAYWRVPASAATAREGTWVPGPGKPLFEALRSALGGLPLVAEDLGDVDETVHQLRRDAGIPCTRVLQFGFDELDSLHAPHRLAEDTLVATGTHDNDTTLGWWNERPAETRTRFRRYSGLRGRMPDDLIRLAITSVARWAVIPMQDVLGLGNEARMNRPGVAEGNWSWRYTALPDPGRTKRLRSLVEVAGRLPG